MTPETVAYLLTNGPALLLLLLLMYGGYRAAKWVGNIAWPEYLKRLDKQEEVRAALVIKVETERDTARLRLDEERDAYVISLKNRDDVATAQGAAIAKSITDQGQTLASATETQGESLAKVVENATAAQGEILQAVLDALNKLAKSQDIGDQAVRDILVKLTTAQVELYTVLGRKPNGASLAAGLPPATDTASGPAQEPRPQVAEGDIKISLAVKDKED